MSNRKGEKRIVFEGQVSDSGRSSTPGDGQLRIFLLSPADATGERAKLLVNPNAQFELARRLRTSGASLGEVYSFMSPLYFRGKLSYAGVFANAPAGIPGSLVITPSRGLVRPEAITTFADLAGLPNERLGADNPKYRDALERDLRALSEAIRATAHVVLLGSIATRKYIPLLGDILGERLFVPRDFVGLGNMQRGALLLRCSRERCELEYVPAADALSD